MKKVKYIPMAVVAMALLAAVVFANAKTVTITVNNKSTHFTGNVNVHCIDYSSLNINCTGSGYFYGSATANGDYCSINGYFTNAGHVGWAIDPSNDTLYIDFRQNNYIVVTDQQIVN